MNSVCNDTQKFKIAPMPLKMFVMNNNDKKLISFDESWYYINHNEECLTIHFIDLETNAKLALDCNVSALVHLRQIS
jgi:hypothetical protein